MTTKGIGCRLQSEMSNRVIEVTERGGEIGLRLGLADQPGSFYEGTLSSILKFSTGRPWRADRMAIREQKAEQLEKGILLSIQGDSVNVRIEVTFDTEGFLRMETAWTNTSDRILADVSVGLEWELDPHDKEMVTIPHMIYNNNPSADPDRVVPHLGVGEGKGLLCEEHRLPIPCVNVEWQEGLGHRFLSFFSLPSYVETADGVVHYGSLGAYQRNGQTTIAAMSGVLMFNGEKDIVYVSKSLTAPYEGGYLDFEPGFTLSKTYVMEWGPLDNPGRGFVEVVRSAIALYNPQGAEPHTLDDIIRLKTAALDDRWRESEKGAGYVKFSDCNSFGLVSKHGLHYMYGWTGQCLKLAWCDAVLGLDGEEESRVKRCEKAVDFYIRQSVTKVPGLRNGAYFLKDGRWDNFNWQEEPVVSTRAYGETVSDLADIILLFRSRGREVPSGWEPALIEAADFFLGSVLPSGIFPAAWRMDGSAADDRITAAGIPCALALLKAYQVTGKEEYKSCAFTCMEQYYELHARTFERPFARSTLDAKCEDKEAGMFFFLAAYELFRMTGEARYKEWAELAADWQLTYVYLWNPVYDRGTAFREAGFQATGWPGVSVQNHHVDVFFPTYELYRFGVETGQETYRRLARMIFLALGQGICTAPGEWGFTVVGEQAEGFFPSNFQGRGRSNTWNPSWVISEVLHHALRFRLERGEEDAGRSAGG